MSFSVVSREGVPARSSLLAFMVKTFGLTHIALAVRDPQRSLRFYQAVLGVVPVWESDDFVQAQTPGSRDVLVFERDAGKAGKPGGVAHFGFRLTTPADITAALEAVHSAGGSVTSHGEFVPGEPYLFARDPDGYELEIWYELPTKVDPPARKKRSKAPTQRGQTQRGQTRT